MTSHDPETPPDRPRASLWIGTYAGGGGKGLYPLRCTTDGWDVDAPVALAQNCSFGVHAARVDLHYLVDEQGGAVGVFRHRGDAAMPWDCLARFPVGGAAPCHIALDHSQSWLAVANYASGSISLQRLAPETGLPVDAPIVRENTGSGPNAARQQSPHAHWVGFSPDNRWLYATDLGTDQVLAFAFDAAAGTLGRPIVAFQAPPGSGPRHLYLHPKRPGLAYLACELTNQLVALTVTGSEFRARAALSTLPADPDTESMQSAAGSIVAHIAGNVAGDRLYVSNRGDDSIAVFALDDQGHPTLLQHVASGGQSPRFFLLIEDERRIIVAHERDHRVTQLDILPDGRLASSVSGIDRVVPGAAFVLAIASPTPVAALPDMLPAALPGLSIV